MSLCVIDVHGDIEGDFEWVVDLPRNATNGEVINSLFPDITKEQRFGYEVWNIKNKLIITFPKSWGDLPFELKGENL